MFDLLQRLNAAPFFTEAAFSVVLLLVTLPAWAVATRAIRRSQLPPEVRRRWLIQTRNAVVVFTLGGLLIIWGPEMRAMALSLVAVAAAIVLATKEVLLCLSGSFVRTSARAFSLGDRIEVGGVRGDVVDLGALTTTVLEVGAGQSNRTGRAVTLPNSLFVSVAVINETPSGDYLLHTLSVPLSRAADWRAAERALLAAAREECSPFMEEAYASLARTAMHKGLELSTVDPRVSFKLVDPLRVDLLVRFPAPVKLRNRVEQNILRRYLATEAESPTAG